MTQGDALSVLPRMCARAHTSLYGIRVMVCHYVTPDSHWSNPCPTSLPGLAAIVVVPNERNTMGSAISIDANGIVTITDNDEPTQRLATPSTRVHDGGDYVTASWHRTRSARRASPVSSWQRSLITNFLSSTAGIAGRGTTCSRSVPRATQGSRLGKAAGGPTGRGSNSLATLEHRRRARHARIAAK